MVSLRLFHLIFILIVFIAADLFGAWAIWSHRKTPDPALLVTGILSFAFGFAVVVYAVWLIRKLDRAKVK